MRSSISASLYPASFAVILLIIWNAKLKENIFLYKIFVYYNHPKFLFFHNTPKISKIYILTTLNNTFVIKMHKLSNNKYQSPEKLIKAKKET